jgi:hypothetical protein
MRRFVVIVLGLLTMAPTTGDIGGCGREPTLLDREDFSRARKEEDCERCQECELDNARCKRACDPKAAFDIVIPTTCRPLHHDGEVCLRALHAVSCDKYATYVDDFSPSTPSECEFCRPPEPPPPSFSDGGAP